MQNNLFWQFEFDVKLFNPSELGRLISLSYITQKLGC